MSRRLEVVFGLTFIMLAVACAAFAKGKQGPVAGTWACVAHGTGQGDMDYTFHLTQAAEQVTGNFTAASPDGGTATHDVQSGSFKGSKLELHFDDPEGVINVTGALSGAAAMKGDWTQADHGGTWECKRGEAAAAGKE